MRVTEFFLFFAAANENELWGIKELLFLGEWEQNKAWSITAKHGELFEERSHHCYLRDKENSQLSCSVKWKNICVDTHESKRVDFSEARKRKKNIVCSRSLVFRLPTKCLGREKRTKFNPANVSMLLLFNSSAE